MIDNCGDLKLGGDYLLSVVETIVEETRDQAKLRRKQVRLAPVQYDRSRYRHSENTKCCHVRLIIRSPGSYLDR